MKRTMILITLIIIVLIIAGLAYELPLMTKVHSYEKELGIDLTEDLVFTNSSFSDIETTYQEKKQEISNEQATLDSLINYDVNKIFEINEINSDLLSQSELNLIYANILYIQTLNDIQDNSDIDFTNIASSGMLDTNGLFNDINLEDEKLNSEQTNFIKENNYSVEDIYNFYYEIKDCIEEQSTLQISSSTTCEPFYVEDVLIVNKNHCLDASYDPGGLTAETSAAFDQMQSDAQNEGINIYASSGYRSYDEQVSTFNYWVSLYGEEEAMRVSAKPGYSEHQTGYVIDVGGENDACLLEECFGEDKEGIWLAENAHKYGFIIRYKQGKEDITGYKYEPWHIRYVGVDLATEIYENDTTLEEYLNIR